MIRKHAYAILLLFTAAGLLLSAYALAHHYGTIGGGCSINEKFSCDIVNKSDYSELAGIPVAGIGLGGYFIIGLVALFYRKEKDPFLAKALVTLAAGGLAFSLYLTYIEAYVLYTWCPICLGSLSAIVGILLTSLILLQDVRTTSVIPAKAGTQDATKKPSA